MTSVTIIIPCYNEKSAVIEKTVADVKASVARYAKAYEILVIDDGSKQAIQAKNATVIHHTQNKGYGAAIKTGLRHAKYDWIGITDADGTYPNKEFPRLLKLTSSYDMIIGYRDRKGIPFMRRFPKWVLRVMASYLSNQNIRDLNSGMRLFKKELAMEFYRLYPNGFSLTSTITMAAHTNGYEVCYVSIPYYKRAGKSHIRPIKDTIRFFNLIIRMALYFNPLRFFLPVTAIFAIAAVLRGLRDYGLQGSFGGLTLVLFFLAFQTLFFGLLAEIVSKR